MQIEFEQMAMGFFVIEHICDNLCRYPIDTHDQEELTAICENCEIPKWVNRILEASKERIEIMKQLDAENERLICDIRELPDQTYRGQPIYVRESEKLSK